ncbi:diacylglycerol/lipid kinase family protein [Glacieibacterium sp.]|uniref:diacylglycerol/lipid kinase family protein n=1 Tax=Glacieibacterium sp. TaxID=2860237 RepID=UPI003B00AA9F
MTDDDGLMTITTQTPAVREAEKRVLAAELSAEKRVTVIVNTRSRKGRKLFDHACKLFSEAGFTLDATYAVPDPKELDTTVCRAIEAGAQLVAVGGGDGTLSSVSRHFVGKPVVFGVLPLGTANSFARTLGIPQDLKGAIDVLATGRVADIDLGKVGDRYFTNAAAIGLPAMIGETVPHGLKAVLGRIGYFGWALYSLARFKPFHCTLIENGTEKHFEALEVRISNGTHLGGLEVAAEASLESLDLTIQVVTGRNGWTLAKSWALSAAGRQGGEALVSLRTKGLRIVTDPPMSVSIDGEVMAKTPIEVSVARQVLKLMVPHEADIH